MGSWKFIVVQTIIVCVWLVANVIVLIRPFDPYPFILLNLAFSLQAAYAAPLILLASEQGSHPRPLDARARGVRGRPRGGAERATPRGQ